MKSSFNVSLDDEIDIMDIRVLNFSEEKFPADLAPYWHQVSQVLLDQQTVSFTGDITDMISQAVMSEWKQALASLVKHENIKALAEKYRTLCSGSRHYRSRTRCCLQNEHNLFSDLAITDPYDQVNDRLFVSQARTIVTRKTVFCCQTARHQAQCCIRKMIVTNLSVPFRHYSVQEIPLSRWQNPEIKPAEVFQFSTPYWRRCLPGIRSYGWMKTRAFTSSMALAYRGDTGTGKSAAAKHLATKDG
jgi:hypothetical protein